MVDPSFWTNVISGLTAGLATSIAWAVILLGVQWWNDFVILTSIKKSIKPDGTIHGAEGATGVTLENKSTRQVTIRSVELIGGGDRRVTINFSLNESLSPQGTQENERGWVDLPPMTKGVWTFPFNEISAQWTQRAKPIHELRITLHYQTLLGRTKILYVGTSNKLNAHEFEWLLSGAGPWEK